jgi:uncharacterized membrane protein
MTRRDWALAMSALALLAPAVTAAAPAKAGKTSLSGTFVREQGDNKITFAFQADGSLTVTIANSAGASLSVLAEYTVARDGETVYGVVAKSDNKDLGPGPEPGVPFSFKIEKKEGELVIKDLRGQDTDNAKIIIEGEYKATK